MITLSLPNEYFSPKATLECGQVFRFTPFDGGYLLISADKACLLREENKTVFLTCEEADETYFRNYFDLQTDYEEICAEAETFGVPFLSAAASFGKGLRILRQDKAECILSFLVSQQNNIPRIKGILSRIAAALGEKKSFLGQTYHAFPSLRALAEKSEEFYRQTGLGYRAKYVADTSRRLFLEGLSPLENKRGSELKKALTSYMGVGNKVADCISLFAFHETAAFPVDTWIEKLYHQDFGGTETDREKINRFFVEKFGRNGGLFQQYLFYYKRESTRASV